jgi:DNA processing protein
MIEHADDLLMEMNWQQQSEPQKNRKQKRQLSLVLSDNEQKIYNTLNEQNELAIDELAGAVNMNVSLLAATLLEMEMNGILVSLPGKRYRLI